MRIATWNIAQGRRAHGGVEAITDYLRQELIPDLALLQEAYPVEGAEETVNPRPGGISSHRPWRSLIVSYGPRLTQVNEVQSQYQKWPWELLQTWPGTMAVADVEVPGEEPVTVVSLYGLMDNAYAYTTLHKLLSDLTPLIDTRRGKRLIIGGDLNGGTQTTDKWRRRYENFWTARRRWARGPARAPAVSGRSRAPPAGGVPAARRPTAGT